MRASTTGAAATLPCRETQATVRRQGCGVASEGVMVQPLGRNVWQLLIRLSIHPTHDPASHPQLLIPEKCKHTPQRGLWRMFTAFFTAAKKRKKDQLPISREVGSKRHVQIKKSFSMTEGRGHSYARQRGCATPREAEKPRCKEFIEQDSTCVTAERYNLGRFERDSGHLRTVDNGGRGDCVGRRVGLKGTPVTHVCAPVTNPRLALKSKMKNNRQQMLRRSGTIREKTSDEGGGQTDSVHVRSRWVASDLPGHPRLMRGH